MFKKAKIPEDAKADSLSAAMTALPGAARKLHYALMWAEWRKKFPGRPVRTLKDMNESEIQTLEKKYNCAVIRPKE